MAAASPTQVDNNLETFSLVWLDASVNSSQQNVKAQQQLRTSINYLKTFEHVDKCEQYIRSVFKEDRIILIVSGRLGQEIVPRIHQLQQVSAIYVHCLSADKKKYEQWAKNYAKVNEVFVFCLIGCILRFLGEKCRREIGRSRD